MYVERLESRVNAVFCVARDEHVLGDVDSRSGTLLYRDDGQTIEELFNICSLSCAVCAEIPFRIWVLVSNTLPLLPTWASPPMPPTAAATTNELR